MKQLKRILNFFVGLVLIILLFLAYGSVNNRFYRVVTIEGESMAPTLRYGDMIVVTPPGETDLLGKIVVMNIDGHLVTHRLIGYDETERPITKGDANEAIDQFGNPNLSIAGICRLRLPYLGYPLLFLSNLLAKI